MRPSSNRYQVPGDLYSVGGDRVKNLAADVTSLTLWKTERLRMLRVLSHTAVYTEYVVNVWLTILCGSVKRTAAVYLVPGSRCAYGTCRKQQHYLSCCRGCCRDDLTPFTAVYMYERVLVKCAPSTCAAGM